MLLVIIVIRRVDVVPKDVDVNDKGFKAKVRTATFR